GCRASRVGESNAAVYARSRLGEGLFAGQTCQILRGDGIQARNRRLVIHFGLRWIDRAIVRIAIRHRNAQWWIELVHQRKAGDLRGGGGRFCGDISEIGWYLVEYSN